MVKVILHGCNGRMGRMFTDMCENDDKIKIVEGVDITGENLGGYPVCIDINECRDADVVVDFSDYKAADEVMDWCAKKEIPLVLCTMGLSGEQIEHRKRVSERTAVFHSNTAIGFNLLAEIVREIGSTLTEAGFKIDTVEMEQAHNVNGAGGHNVRFLGVGEEFVLSNKTYSLEAYAKGAIQAAKFMAGKPCGFYTMADVLKGES